jgi:hypothetical protein
VQNSAEADRTFFEAKRMMDFVALQQGFSRKPRHQNYGTSVWQIVHVRLSYLTIGDSNLNGCIRLTARNSTATLDALIFAR